MQGIGGKCCEEREVRSVVAAAYIVVLCTYPYVCFQFATVIEGRAIVQ